jgi:hypothetical protein
MKLPKKLSLSQPTLLVTLALSLMPALCGAADNSKTPAVAPASPRSVFDVPTNAKDGRDPFFPESSRLADEAARAAAATVASSTTEVSSLKVPGISGTPGHLLAIINNHTFSVGDEGDVITTSGRIHLRCVDIQPDAVTVEIGGRIHRIKPDSE